MAEKTGFRVHLSDNKYIIGNGSCFWIADECERQTRNGDTETYQKRLTGYYSDIPSLIDSYVEGSVKRSEIDGELADLAEMFRQAREESRMWREKMKEVLK